MLFSVNYACIGSEWTSYWVCSQIHPCKLPWHLLWNIIWPEEAISELYEHLLDSNVSLDWCNSSSHFLVLSIRNCVGMGCLRFRFGDFGDELRPPCYDRMLLTLFTALNSRSFDLAGSARFHRFFRIFQTRRPRRSHAMCRVLGLRNLDSPLWYIGCELIGS